MQVQCSGGRFGGHTVEVEDKLSEFGIYADGQVWHYRIDRNKKGVVMAVVLVAVHEGDEQPDGLLVKLQEG